MKYMMCNISVVRIRIWFNASSTRGGLEAVVLHGADPGWIEKNDQRTDDGGREAGGRILKQEWGLICLRQMESTTLKAERGGRTASGSEPHGSCRRTAEEEDEEDPSRPPMGS